MGFDHWVASGCPPPDEAHLRIFMRAEGRFDDVLCQLRYTEDVDEVIVLNGFDFDARRAQLEVGLRRVCKHLGLQTPSVPVDGNNLGRPDSSFTWHSETVDRLAARYSEEISQFGFQIPSFRV